MPFRPLTPEHVDRLSVFLGPEAVRQDAATLARYGQDETENLCFLPEVVVLPRTTAEVMKVMALAHQLNLPVTPRGAGTGLSGGALPVQGGIVLSLERLDRIRTIDEQDLVVEVEVGVKTGDLQRQVEARGLFYPPDPASRDSCTLGGNLAEDSAGPRSCKYGSTRHWVLGLEAVLPDGRRLKTGGRNRKDVAGYNLTQLLVGSEGTLAVLTAATLKLIPLPAAHLTLLLPFPDLEPAAQAITALFYRGHLPAACELLEERALLAVGEVLELPPQLRGHRAIVLLELDGSEPETLLAEAAALGELGEEFGAGPAIVAQDAAEARRLWAIRRKIGEAVKHRSVYKEADCVVPRSQLARLVQSARQIAHEHGVEVLCYGHAGDGNLHVNILRGELGGDWAARRDAVEAALFAAVVALGGSITGEHGVGFTQRRYLELVTGEVGLAVLRNLKSAFDPQGILNPGKIFP